MMFSEKIISLKYNFKKIFIVGLMIGIVNINGNTMEQPQIITPEVIKTDNSTTQTNLISLNEIQDFIHGM